MLETQADVTARLVRLDRHPPRRRPRPDRARHAPGRGPVRRLAGRGRAHHGDGGRVRHRPARRGGGRHLHRRRCGGRGQRAARSPDLTVPPATAGFRALQQRGVGLEAQQAPAPRSRSPGNARATCWPTAWTSRWRRCSGWSRNRAVEPAASKHRSTAAMPAWAAFTTARRATARSRRVAGLAPRRARGQAVEGLEQEGPGRPGGGLGPGHHRLDDVALGQPAGAAVGRLHLGQLDQVVDRAPGDPEGDGGVGREEQWHRRHPPHRPRRPRREGERQGVAAGDVEGVDRVVVAGGALQARGVPGVGDGDGRGREEGQEGLRAPLLVGDRGRRRRRPSGRRRAIQSAWVTPLPKPHRPVTRRVVGVDGRGPSRPA